MLIKLNSLGKEISLNLVATPLKNRYFAQPRPIIITCKDVHCRLALTIPSHSVAWNAELSQELLGILGLLRQAQLSQVFPNKKK